MTLWRRPRRSGGAPLLRRSALEGRFPGRLVGFCALLCLAPLALLSYLTIHLAEGAVVREVNARVRTTSAVTAALVQQQMQGVAELTTSYARRPFLIGALADGNPARFRRAEIDQQLTELHAAQHGSAGAFVTDLSCRLTNLMPASPGTVGKDFSFRDWCKGVVATDRPYVSDAYKTAALGHPLVVAAAAIVRDDAGKPLGILVTLYTLDAIADFSGELALAQGVRLLITDKRGSVIAGGSGPAGGAEALESAATDPRVREALAGRPGVTRSATEDGELLSAFAPVKQIGWTVTAQVPAREALAGVRKLRSAVLVIAGVLGLVLLAGVALLARALQQRRKVQGLLVERESQTQAILEAAADAFFSTDAGGLITAWNGQAQTVFGWTEAEALGRRLTETIIPPAQREEHDRDWPTS